MNGETPRMAALHRVATACATVPMLTGVSIFLLWLILRQEGLTLLGAMIILVGLALLPIGLLALAGYYWMGTKQSDVPAQQLRSSTLKGVSLLLSNFLVAGAIIAAVLAIACRYTVIVHNDSPRALDHVRVHGAGVDLMLGTIQPGATVERTFCIDQEGEIIFEAASGSAAYSKVLSGYVNKIHGEREGTVRIDSRGDITVTQGPSWGGL